MGAGEKETLVFFSICLPVSRTTIKPQRMQTEKSKHLHLLDHQFSLPRCVSGRKYNVVKMVKCRRRVGRKCVYVRVNVYEMRMLSVASVSVICVMGSFRFELSPNRPVFSVSVFCIWIECNDCYSAICVGSAFGRWLDGFFFVDLLDALCWLDFFSLRTVLFQAIDNAARMQS